MHTLFAKRDFPDGIFLQLVAPVWRKNRSQAKINMPGRTGFVWAFKVRKQELANRARADAAAHQSLHPRRTDCTFTCRYSQTSKNINRLELNSNLLTVDALWLQILINIQKAAGSLRHKARCSRAAAGPAGPLAVQDSDPNGGQKACNTHRLSAEHWQHNISIDISIDFCSITSCTPNLFAMGLRSHHSQHFLYRRGETQGTFRTKNGSNLSECG